MAIVSATGALACPAAPEPMLALEVVSRYAEGDSTRSTLDERAEADAVEAVAPLDEFIRDLAQQTEAMLKASSDADRAAMADCILSRLAGWARADALSVLTGESGQLTIGARLAAFAIMALQARPFATGDVAIAEVSDWLNRRLWQQMRFWETAPEGAARGNLRAWAALAAAAGAVLTDDPVARGWATWSVAYVLCSANDDGSLPREMERGARALHYQLHAVAPLTVATLLLDGAGSPVRGLCGNALDRAVDFTLTDLLDGTKSAEITGEVQTLFDGSEELRNHQLAWLEAYLLIGTDAEVLAQAQDWAALMRPLKNSKLGGNQTLMFGAAPVPEGGDE